MLLGQPASSHADTHLMANVLPTPLFTSSYLYTRHLTRTAASNKNTTTLIG